jgi:hypothetical protein
MANYPLLDLFTTEAGDLQVGYNGDLLVARDSDVVEQEVLWRVKTTQGDWVLEPQCGANLEDLIGLPQVEATGHRLEDQLREALTHDGFLSSELREVLAVPVNRDTLVGYLRVEYGAEEFDVQVTLDLREGIL